MVFYITLVLVFRVSHTSVLCDLPLNITPLGEINLQGVNQLVKMYGSEETRAFCCNCKEVTLHRYESFSKPKEVTEKKAKGFLSGLFAAIVGALMEGEATGDYKCTVCGTNLHTPDNLD